MAKMSTILQFGHFYRAKLAKLKLRERNSNARLARIEDGDLLFASHKGDLFLYAFFYRYHPDAANFHAVF
jgi:hypothetical protein